MLFDIPRTGLLTVTVLPAMSKNDWEFDVIISIISLAILLTICLLVWLWLFPMVFELLGLL